MTIKKNTFTPLLARFEEIIDTPEVNYNISYSPEKMPMMDGETPLVVLKSTCSQGVTRHTRVSQETQDDD